jgi:hypothetical protein
MEQLRICGDEGRLRAALMRRIKSGDDPCSPRGKPSVSDGALVPLASASYCPRGMSDAPRPFKDRPLVYVAGPYTRPDPVENTNRAILLAAELAEEGFVTPVVPHLTLLWHLVSPQPLTFWYGYDVAILDRCDAIYRIEGESTGADDEVAFARAKELPVFTNRDELREWAQGQVASDHT